MHNGAYPRNSVGRHGSWKADPAFESDWQQTGVSNYSKGHFVASNYRQANTDANDETFYYTNQAPQWQESFNSGVWSQLEEDVVAAATTGRDTLYVVVGTLYESNKTSDGIPVPSHFYKLLMKCSFNSSGVMTSASGCAYLFTNEAHSGDSYSSFITTIDAVEQRAGFDFFANVPSSLQASAEASRTPLW
jgi:DNA/RNA endonuclease G (NUC1)